MTDTHDVKALILAADRPAEQTVSHPMNSNSEMNWVSLSDGVGLDRIGVHVIRLAPGKESCVYHTHVAEEEWLYILSGKGVAEIDGGEYEVGPGDFMGFATPSVGHHLRNDFEEDLIYLVGGERKPLEIAEFPNLGKVVVRSGETADMVDRDRLERLWPPVLPDDADEV